MKNGFGIIHNLAQLEKDLKNEMAILRNQIYIARQMLNETDPSIEDLKRFLDGAMASAKRLSGD